MTNATVSFFNDFYTPAGALGKSSRVSRTASKESAKRARKAQRVARRNNRK